MRKHWPDGPQGESPLNPSSTTQVSCPSPTPVSATAGLVGIVIIAHAPLASAMTACLQHIYGLVPAHVEAVDICAALDVEQSRAQAVLALERARTEAGVLVLTDLAGSTPGKIAASLASADVDVLAGLSLPMLLRSVCYRKEVRDTVATKAMEGAQNGTQRLSPEEAKVVAAAEVPECLSAARIKKAKRVACAA